MSAALPKGPNPDSSRVNQVSSGATATPGFDHTQMTRALQLAQYGLGWASPNALSGAVVVKDGEVAGEGFFQCSGQPHAETNAIETAGSRTNGGTLYVLVEPCWHANRDCCVTRILNAGIERVVVASEDPNPAIARKGIGALRDAGITVDVGLEAEAAMLLNEAVYKYLATRRPFVTLFATVSFDGKVATSIGERPSPPGEILDLMRASADAVMVGVGSILQDDSDFATRWPRARPPLCLVIDGMARTPISARILAQPTPGARPQSIIVATRYAPDDKIRDLKAVGAEIVMAQEVGDPLAANIDLSRLMAMLGKREIASVLIEGCGTLSDAALAAGVVDKICLYLYPAILGGTSAPTLVGGLGVSFIEEAQSITRTALRPCGAGWLLEGYLE